MQDYNPIRPNDEPSPWPTNLEPTPQGALPIPILRMIFGQVEFGTLANYSQASRAARALAAEIRKTRWYDQVKVNFSNIAVSRWLTQNMDRILFASGGGLQG